MTSHLFFEHVFDTFLLYSTTYIQFYNFVSYLSLLSQRVLIWKNKVETNQFKKLKKYSKTHMMYRFYVTKIVLHSFAKISPTSNDAAEKLIIQRNSLRRVKIYG